MEVEYTDKVLKVKVKLYYIYYLPIFFDNFNDKTISEVWSNVDNKCNKVHN